MIETNDFIIWIEQSSSIHIKLKHPYYDPIELNEDQATELSNILARFAKEIKDQDDCQD